MTTLLDANKVKKNEMHKDEILGIWTCGCTSVGSVTPVNIRCIKCGNDFIKVGNKKKLQGKKTKGDVKIELVNNIQNLYEEELDLAVCHRCADSGEVKVYTQEWDMIKSHMSPCPDCQSLEWLDWSADKRLIDN